MGILKFNNYIDMLSEGLLKSYDIDFVIEKSKQRLSVINIKHNIVKLPNNTIKITFFNFNKVYIDPLFNFLNSNFTNLFGWFPSHMSMTNLSGMENQMNYDENYLISTYEYLDEVSIIYESKFDIESDIPNEVYHISIQEYEDKILKSGIVPKTKSKISEHGDRIYICKTSDDCEEMISKMKFYFFNKNPLINTKWIIYKIDTSGLEFKLYKDPNFINKGFYLLGNIPPSNISVFSKEK
jgi:hypothetical protein